MKTLNPKSRWRLKWVGLALGIGLLIPALEVALVRFLPPPATLPMTARWLAGRFNPAYQPSQYHWVALTQVADAFLTGVWRAEDNQFFVHWGFDWQQIKLARAEALASGRPPRGASTITQQCARSLFLWPGRSWLRKGLEAYYTVWMELLLPKRRILELYVNVIELGDGLYGVDAAAHKYYGLAAAQLNRNQAAMLVAIMPNPKHWNPLLPDARVLERQAVILRRSEFARLPGS